ncbi:MAG: tryptophan--tRNA ligase [Candidatus Nanopelagicales bacterium]
MSARESILSGIQPTADSFHIGNYLGALRHWVAMQETHESFLFIADLHAITKEHDPAELRRRVLISFAQVLACGMDPDRSTIFVQSQVPEHAQLSWVLSCLTGMGEAGRMTQFKDQTAKHGSERASVGFFTYPILQAADILLYQAHGVPVGEDQRQHLELTRDLAQRFNNRFGETLRVPEPYIAKHSAKIKDLLEPTAKMSKSSPAGCVFLLDPVKRIEKKIKTAVTDSETVVAFDPDDKPGVSNLLTILAAFTDRPVEEVAATFAGRMYGHLKAETAAATVDFAGPYQQRVAELMADPGELARLMAVGAEKARAVAAATLARVYDRVGFVA